MEKKQNMNVRKATLNYYLAEQYALITKLQEKQTMVIKHAQEDHTQAIESKTKQKY